MSEWHCLHLEDTLTAIVVSDMNRFHVRLREPQGQRRNSIELYRGNPKEAQRAADRLVQAYYPHDCEECGCGTWARL